MLERLLKLKVAVIAVLHRNDKRDSCQLIFEGPAVGARDGCCGHSLSPFERMTDVLGEQKYVTARLLLPVIQRVHKRCEQPAFEDETARRGPVATSRNIGVKCILGQYHEL